VNGAAQVREQPVRASASVVAAGVVALLLGALGAFSTGATLVLFSVSSIPGTERLPPSLRPFLYGIWIFLFLSSLFVAVAGVQALQLRRWARFAMLVIAGCLLLFGLVGIVLILFTIFVAPPDPAVSKAVMAAVLSFIYGIPAAVGLWWLFLFLKPSVRAQFEGTAAPAESARRSPSVFNNPRCPMAVRVVGWYLASFVLLIPFLPFLPGNLPVYSFGRVFRGSSATVLLILHFLLLAVPGIGLLLLKRWSYPVALASQALLCLNALTGTFSRAYEAALRSMYAQMELPVFPSDALFSYLRYFNLLGLVVPLAILAALAVSRRSFYAAATEARTPGSGPPV
jgi:hypothetical protein